MASHTALSCRTHGAASAEYGVGTRPPRRREESERLIANLSVWGLGVLLALTVALAGLNAVAGRASFVSGPVNSSASPASRAEHTHHIQPLP